MDSHKLVPLHVLFQTRAVSYSEGLQTLALLSIRFTNIYPALVAAVTLLTWDIFITFSDEVGTQFTPPLCCSQLANTRLSSFGSELRSWR